MKRRNLIRAILSIIVIGILTLGGAYMYHFRPLVSAAPWKARVTHATSGAIDASVYRMLFCPSRIFIELPKTHRDCYWWFALDTDRKAVGVPSSPRREPYLHQNHDMNLGVGLKDQKIEDTWTVDWNDRGVTFANRNLKIELTQ